VRAPANGYTLLMVGPANAINASLYDGLKFNFLRDIAPVAAITREPLVMLIHPSVPAKSVPEFIAYAKANPGKIKMASTGIGSSPHVSGLLFTSESVPLAASKSEKILRQWKNDNRQKVGNGIAVAVTHQLSL
jgi:tripartite-type tricarboxylate transporter receptor subunit TctC